MAVDIISQNTVHFQMRSVNKIFTIGWNPLFTETMIFFFKCNKRYLKQRSKVLFFNSYWFGSYNGYARL